MVFGNGCMVISTSGGLKCQPCRYSTFLSRLSRRLLNCAISPASCAFRHFSTRSRDFAEIQMRLHKVHSTDPSTSVLEIPSHRIRVRYCHCKSFFEGWSEIRFLGGQSWNGGVPPVMCHRAIILVDSYEPRGVSFTCKTHQKSFAQKNIGLRQSLSWRKYWSAHKIYFHTA